MAPYTASAKSAWLNTIKGAFPPSSSAILFTDEPAIKYNCLPTTVEPVKEMTEISALSANSFPIEGAFSRDVGIKLKTPLGMPHFSTI